MSVAAAAPLQTAGSARLLRLVGLVAVLLPFLTSQSRGESVWVWAATIVSCLGWLGWALLPNRLSWAQAGCLVAMALFGGLICGPVPIATISVVAAIFAAIAMLEYPLAFGVGVTAVGTITSTLSSILHRDNAVAIISTLGGIVVVVLMGWSRRQFRVSAEQNRRLVEQTRVIRAERDRAAALAERGRIARDIHDVLAHTLGGLVLQLDAADALIEAGDIDGAAQRVRASHALAVSGLNDARDVVGTLRADRVDLAAEIERLAGEHRSAGERVSVSIEGDASSVDQQGSVALVRVLQESLTNARKHAQGAPVTVTLQVDPNRTELVVINDRAAQSAILGVSGAGVGLLGMRERIVALGGTLDAGKDGDRWRVQIAIPRR
ncbi:sensor histidine kinase [Antrihabitans cavernicola]|uniref:histidine kinase n=1 Tax=Antrihabitans cavernicola TaxID=2495913 RepID=A0A5A7S9H4_9NOCA|nr:histidine kinase [Spelaeibacter cavernicola]KAA0021195.1 hypothetical protein FOY51_20000 [Spelaeibacter cavernicola]